MRFLYFIKEDSVVNSYLLHPAIHPPCKKQILGYDHSYHQQFGQILLLCLSKKLIFLLGLKINSGKELPYLKFGNSSDLRVGQWVMAVGNPFGLGGSVSVGTPLITGKSFAFVIFLCSLYFVFCGKRQASQSIVKLIFIT